MSTKPTLLDRAALAFCVALSVLVVSLHVREYRPLSPIDELQHLDYLYKAPSGHIVARGERIGQAALRDETCRGLDAPIALPSCTAPAPLDPDEFQERGFNTASVHPPTYYFLTGTAAKAVRNVFGWSSLHTAGRALGAVWLSLAVAIMWRLLVFRGARPLTQVALLSMLIVSPAVIMASATVSPDATGLFAGALVLAAVLLWEDGRVPAWVPPLAVAGALALKFTHIAVVGVAVVYLAIRALQQGRPADWRTDAVMRRYAVVVVGVVGSAFVMLAVWSVVQAIVAKVPQAGVPMNESLRANGFPLADLLGQVDAVVSPLKGPYFSPVLRNRYIVALNHVLDLATLLALASAAVFAVARSRERALAAAAGVAMITLGPVTVLSTYYGTNAVTPTPTRYGLPIMPAVLLAALAAMERRWVRRGVTAVSAVVVFVVVYRLKAA